MFGIYFFNTNCYKSWQALATISGNFRGMKNDIIWAYPLKRNLPRKHQEQSSEQGFSFAAANNRSRGQQFKAFLIKINLSNSKA